MLQIQNQKEGSRLTLALSGRLDTVTAPQLEETLQKEIAEVKELVFDFEGLEYMSSAGLRILLSAQKIMNRQGSMTLKNVSPELMEILEITGFADILTIE